MTKDKPKVKPLKPDRWCYTCLTDIDRGDCRCEELDKEILSDEVFEGFLKDILCVPKEATQ